MQTMKMSARTTAASSLARRAPARLVVVRSSEEQLEASTSGRSVAAPFSILNSTNEAINGRAAMLGFVSAVTAEALTHHTVFSQLAGRYENQELVEKAIGASDLTFGMIVALVTMGTLAPRMLENAAVDSKSFGPFTPGLEKTLGRAAMMGFAGVLIIEAIKGSSLL